MGPVPDGAGQPGVRGLVAESARPVPVRPGGRRGVRWVTAAATVLVLAVGCGPAGASPVAGSVPAVPAGPARPANARPAGGTIPAAATANGATLAAHVHVLGLSRAVAFLRLTDLAGHRVAEQRLVGEDQEIGIRLAAGTYRLVGFRRTCGRTCATLGPPVGACRSTVALHQGERVEVHILVGPDGCEVIAEAPPQ